MEEPNINYKRLYELSIIEKNNLLKEIDFQKDELINCKNKIIDLTKRLEKYTYTEKKKEYYEKNKDKIIEKVKEYNKNNKTKIDCEKIKEYNKRAYEKRKLKLQNNT